ncbi:spore germination protein [Paenibacillus sp. CGMCC 1.16610]|uniref:Spore germination protein n=1 Tax=Paenibacillus anseongense TaxID=2682845 RepID=A0ABW9UJD7_9BACL|nr:MULTISPECIES: spore germination protein [Paenibacillus]MBA2939791.1 spore germination protein [Paenibacillus sp. CGMCC 1.16610]MVQ39451.1 spore germination protein [Paenibacillus anseongense]
MKETHDDELESGDFELSVAQIKDYFACTEDLKVQKFIYNSQSCSLLYLEDLVKTELMQSNVIKPLLESNSGNIEQIFSSIEAKKSSDIHQIGKYLLDGFCAIVIENEVAAIMMSVAQTQGRSIQEPKDEQIIKGSHEGFVENISTNIYLLRNRIKSPKLKVRYYTLGNVTNTKVAMIYMENRADPLIVNECEKRISAFDLDYLYSVGNIDEMIEEHPLSPFPQSLQTERPDRAVSYLMEGKINIIVDGMPSVLVLPITFFSFFQSPDDYNGRWILGSFFRIIRFISFILAVSMPAIYIAIVSYHSEVLPIGILYSIQVSLAYVPLPPILEALVMQILLELLKEAAIRLPSPIAQTIGIVGGLVIGTAVVEAHLVSNTMIVVIGLTAIASFATPLNEFGTSLRILGFPTMLAAALFGLFGISIMMMVIFIHLCKIETLGVPYFAPFGPYHGKQGLKDIFLRLPIWKGNNNSQSFESGRTNKSYFRRWKRT